MSLRTVRTTIINKANRFAVIKSSRYFPPFINCPIKRYPWFVLCPLCGSMKSPTCPMHIIYN